MNTPAAWFHNAVIDGVQLLYSLALNGGPAAEVLPLTTTGWIETLWRARGSWEQHLDAQRLQAGFISLAGACERWPAPKQLLDHLPARPELPAITYAPPPVTADKRLQLAALRRRVTDVLSTTPQVCAVRPYITPMGGCDDGAVRGTLCAEQHAPAAAERVSREQ